MLNFNIITLSQTNCYLLKCKTGYCLIDCGSSSDKKALIKSIGRLGIDFCDIHYLILTHHHIDHCGLLNFLISENPELVVIMSKKCAEYLQTGHHHKHENERYSNTRLKHILSLFFKLNKNWSESFTPYFTRKSDQIIEADNDALLPQLGIKGIILITPGHTEDSISAVIEKTAFVGDAARNILNFTGTPYSPILIYDPEVYQESWKKLITSGAKVFYPAHGKAFPVSKLNITSC